MSRSVCAFIGQNLSHFSFGFDEENQKCAKLKFTMLKEISKLVENGVTEFLSGMALGVDIWGVEIVLALQKQGKPVRLVCVLPSEEQANKWSESERERYFTLLEKSDDVHYIGSHNTESCMRDQNKYLVDHSNILLAVYDGKSTGSVEKTVCYAHALGKSILIINCDTFRVIPFMIVIPSRQHKI